MKFSLNSPVLDYINTLVSFVVLNLVFLVCCIPVVTIGPALAALYHVTLKEAKKEYGYILRTYFRYFAKCFGKAFLISVGLAAPFGLVLFAFFFWNAMGSAAATAAATVLAIIGIVIYASGMYAFPLLARYENTFRQTLRNAFSMAIGHPLYTVILLAVDAAFGACLLFTDAGKIFMGIVGFAFAAMCKSVILVKVFEKYEVEEEV